MAIPNQLDITLPLLKFLSDGQVHTLNDCVEAMSQHFALTEDEKNEMLPTGRAERFKNRVQWARAVLKSADLLAAPQRGRMQLTDSGRAVLSQSPTVLDRKFLLQFEGYRKLIGVDGKENAETDPQELPEQTPETTSPYETMSAAYQAIQKNLVEEILDTVKGCSPDFFEKLVVELLVKMGYGGSLEEAGQVVGRSGDGGIDGVISEDRLGLDVLYVQAKRWESSVSSPTIQQFVGALQGKKAQRGVVITTSDFSNPAREYAESVLTKVILIDGEQLARYMIEYAIGVETETVYELKRVNSSYFDDSE